MAIYPDKKDGKLTGRFRVEVQLVDNRKHVYRIARAGQELLKRVTDL